VRRREGGRETGRERGKERGRERGREGERERRMPIIGLEKPPHHLLAFIAPPIITT
jgi:hypothetical protein